MATIHSKPGERLHQTNSIPVDEASWQQLMVFNYVVFEAIDAMKQERASTPRSITTGNSLSTTFD